MDSSASVEGGLATCPVCGIRLSALHIEVHVNQCLEWGPAAAAAASATEGVVSCPSCGLAVPLTELSSHELMHTLQVGVGWVGVGLRTCALQDECPCMPSIAQVGPCTPYRTSEPMHAL